MLQVLGVGELRDRFRLRLILVEFSPSQELPEHVHSSLGQLQFLRLNGQSEGTTMPTVSLKASNMLNEARVRIWKQASQLLGQ